MNCGFIYTYLSESSSSLSSPSEPYYCIY